MLTCSCSPDILQQAGEGPACEDQASSAAVGPQMSAVNLVRTFHSSLTRTCLFQENFCGLRLSLHCNIVVSCDFRRVT